MERSNSANQDSVTIPTPALVWGWGGVIPFASICLILGFAEPSLAAFSQKVLVPYGAIILTFMGGVHWGLQMVREAPENLLYTTGIGPSMFAVLAILLPVQPALIILSVGFVGLLLFDLWLMREGRVPRWYGRLRIQLTSAVLICLTIAGVMMPGSVAS